MKKDTMWVIRYIKLNFKKNLKLLISNKSTDICTPHKGSTNPKVNSIYPDFWNKPEAEKLSIIGKNMLDHKLILK